MSGKEFYLLTLLYGLKKFTDLCNQICKKNHSKDTKKLNITSLEHLIPKNNYFQGKKELINKLYQEDGSDPYINIITQAEKILGNEYANILQSHDLLLEPIFDKVFPEKNNSKNRYTYSFQGLNLDNIFPKPYTSKDNVSMINHLSIYLKELKSELEKVDNEEKLYYLLQKYLWCISFGDKITSLFDYIKSLSCIALCLYEENKAGELKWNEIDDEEHFILINGDISGIQDFIFNISSKGAAKSLKGRSVYLNLLLEIIVKYIMDELELYDTNLIYNGGGNFYIIAPACRKENLEEIRKSLLEKLLSSHNGEIYVALSHVTLKSSDFIDFTDNWRKVGERTDKLKRIKWSELDLEHNYEKIFGPLDEGTLDKNQCSVCSISDFQRKIRSISDNEDICNLCSSFRDLTDKLKDAKYISFSKAAKDAISDTYNNIFRLFGYEVDMYKELPTLPNNHSIYKINATDYLEDDCAGFKFGAYNLPLVIDTEDKKERVVTFEELAQRSIDEGIGDKKLGYLKLDVDNLGSIFINGLKENKSIIHVAALSRMLGLFFEGYVNRLLDELKLKDKIYIVFSGGDDTFIIGAWNATLKFSNELYDKFQQYTCHNPSITFSASLGVYRYNYPVIRAAANSEEQLEKAKGYIGKKEERPQKNKVSLFQEVFNWTEFKKIIEIKDFLVELIAAKKESRSLLEKIMRSTKGFKKIIEDSAENKLNNIRFWRLAYYLRDLNNKDSAEKIIGFYREIVMDNLLNKSKDEKIKNIMIIPATVRWAELETKDNVI